MTNITIATNITFVTTVFLYYTYYKYYTFYDYYNSYLRKPIRFFAPSANRIFEAVVAVVDDLATLSIRRRTESPPRRVAQRR